MKIRNYIVFIFMFFCFQYGVLVHASGAQIKIIQPDIKKNRNSYEMTIYDNKKPVVVVKEETGTPPLGPLTAYTFSGKYCGFPAQAAIITYDSGPAGDPDLRGTGIDIYVFDRRGWRTLTVGEDYLKGIYDSDKALKAYISTYRNKFQKDLLQCLRVDKTSDKDPNALVKQKSVPEASPIPLTRCGSAYSATEKTICANPLLVSLDRTLADAYHHAFMDTLPRSIARNRLIQTQRSWLKSRDVCASNYDCLVNSYRKRIYALQESGSK